MVNLHKVNLYIKLLLHCLMFFVKLAISSIINLPHFFSELFEMNQTNQAVSQVSEILISLCQNQIPESSSNSIDLLIDAMVLNHHNNPKLVELLSSLAVRTGVNVRKLRFSVWLNWAQIKLRCSYVACFSG